jgi:hypothetical protein
MHPARFRKAATSARPYGSHRYDVFGPKIGRRLTLFGRQALQQWLRLEADPFVVTYCERPLLVPETATGRAADFWVGMDDGELLYLIARPAEATLLAEGHGLYPALQAWTRACSMTLRFILPVELDDSETLCANRLTMLQYVAASNADISAGLLSSVLSACDGGVSLGELEQRCDGLNPAVVRTAVFSLMLSGRLACPTIASQPLGARSHLVRPCDQ